MSRDLFTGPTLELVFKYCFSKYVNSDNFSYVLCNLDFEDKAKVL